MLHPVPCPRPPAHGGVTCYGCNDTYIITKYTTPYWCPGCQAASEHNHRRMER
jgi:hypothetical protein